MMLTWFWEWIGCSIIKFQWILSPKKIIFWEFGYPDLEFEGDKRILPTCVISALKAKRLLHKGCVRPI